MLLVNIVKKCHAEHNSFNISFEKRYTMKLSHTKTNINTNNHRTFIVIILSLRVFKRFLIGKATTTIATLELLYIVIAIF